MHVKNVRIQLFIICASIIILFLCTGNHIKINPDKCTLHDVKSSEAAAEMAAAIQPYERVVTTFEELKSALNADNGITTVYLGANITMKAGGINIHSSKASVEIVGINPLNPDQTVPYTLTDYTSSTFTDTIYVNTAGVKNVYVRDLKIIGKNYYGPVSALDSAVTASCIINYVRVDYSGPQIGHNRQGSIKFIDCNININGKNGGSASQEFSETKHLYFEGKNTIATETSTLSIFWLPTGGTFDILDDSSVTLTSLNTSAAYGMFYADGAAYTISISIGKRSVFNANISAAVAPTGNSTISSMKILEDGAFYLTTTKAATMTVFSMGGNLILNRHATFVINGFGGASYSVLDLRTGNITVESEATFQIIASSAYASLLNLYGRSFICNDPASVVFYNIGNRDILATTTAGRVYINAEQINFWNTSPLSTLDNLPLYHWKKADDTNIWIDGTLAAGTGGNFSSLSSNYIAGDSPGTAPSAAAFSMVTARVLSFGRLNINAYTPLTTSSAINGTTAPGAVVRASYTQNSVNYVLPDVTTDPEGLFSIPISIPLVKHTDITVRSNYQYLFASAATTVSDIGRVELSIPSYLGFFSNRLTSRPHVVERVKSDWQIFVSDTRGAGKSWSLFAREIDPLTPAGHPYPPLYNAIIFINKGTVIHLNSSYPTLIYSHTTTSDDEQVIISWASDEGILVEAPVGAVYSHIPYTGQIEWSLVDAPS